MAADLDALLAADLHGNRAARLMLADLLRDMGQDEAADGVENLEEDCAVLHALDGSVVVERSPRHRTDVSVLSPSHVPGMPYERRVEVVTAYGDLAITWEDRPWGLLPEADRRLWREWLSSVHAQEVRRTEMRLTQEEENYHGSLTNHLDWEDLPRGLADALDRIQHERDVVEDGIAAQEAAW